MFEGSKSKNDTNFCRFGFFYRIFPFFQGFVPFSKKIH